MRMKSGQQGVTLIELVVTMVVLAVLVSLAAPSFAEFRERQALRGAADNFVAAIAAAKEEAVKRDSYVRVDFKPFGNNAVCMEAVVETALTDDPSNWTCAGATPSPAPCDSTTQPPPCTAVRFPESDNDLQKVQLVASGISFGGSSSFIIDPKTATLYDINNVGQLTLATSRGYQAAVQINALARPTVCTPASATRSLPGISPCN
jgi:prepilin-type N-terminal cleavage/methylation domain-containing protein